MRWKKMFTREIERRQKVADNAVVQAEVEYLDAVNLQLTSERIARDLLRMQRENSLGYKLFGVNP